MTDRRKRMERAVKHFWGRNVDDIGEVLKILDRELAREIKRFTMVRYSTGDCGGFIRVRIQAFKEARQILRELRKVVEK